MNKDFINSKTFFYRGRNQFFLACVLFSLIILFFVMVFYSNQIKRIAYSGVIELSKNSSQQNAEDIELFFLRHQDYLLTTTEVFEYFLDKNIKATPEEIQNLLHNLSMTYNYNIYTKYASKGFTGIYACVDGSLYHGFKSPKDLPEGYDPTKRQWYKEAIKGNGRIVFGEPYKDIYTQSLVITVTKLLSDKKTVIGMDITLDDLQFVGGDMDVYITLNSKEYIFGYGFILTDDGTVLAHKDFSQQGKSYNDPKSPMYLLFQQVKQCSENNQTYFKVKIDNVVYGIFPQKLSNGWYVVTLIDLNDIDFAMSDLSLIVLFIISVTILMAFLYCIFLTFTRIKSNKLYYKLNDALEFAKKDVLTGNKNRSAYDIRIKELKNNLNTENDESFALLMMDLNDLKYVNDNYGHAAGDQYIKNSCALVKHIFPTEIYRIGGDEFILFLTDDLFTNFENLFNELNKKVSEANSLLVPNVEKPSIAFGFSVHYKNSQEEIETLLMNADSAMYTNKAQIKQSRLKNAKLK